MEVQCITSKKKWLKIEKREDAWLVGNSHTQVQKIYIKWATLSSIFEMIWVDSSGQCHYFNRDWTKKPIHKTKDDDQCVYDINNAAKILVDAVDVECTILEERFKFEGNYGKFGTCSFYAQDQHVISPDGRMRLPYAKIESIWLERAQPSTVIKTFDVTFIVDRKPITLGMVSKVLYRHKFVHQAPSKAIVRHNTRPSRSTKPQNIDMTKIFSEFHVYVTEDDDLNWNVLLKMKQQQGYTWDRVYQEYVGQDELSEDDRDSDGWESEDTEDDGETEEEEIISEDDEEEDYPSGDSSGDISDDDDLLDDEENFTSGASSGDINDDSDLSDDEVEVVGRKRLKHLQSPPAAKRPRVNATIGESFALTGPEPSFDTATDEEYSEDEACSVV